MKKKWNAITKQFRNWIGGEELESEPYTETSHSYSLHEEELNKLRLAARRKNIPLHEALSQAVDHYYENMNHQHKPKISEDRKERNPLLRLEGLATRSLQKMPKGGSQYEGDDATIIR